MPVNYLARIEYLENLENLQELNLSQNRIRTIDGLE